ncbi:MAG: L,D-transpeptidase family protein [Bacteroidetes bacterium]|nr:L,D-transpeptidase family protein [Bacteroidota bacterium]
MHATVRLLLLLACSFPFWVGCSLQAGEGDTVTSDQSPPVPRSIDEEAIAAWVEVLLTEPSFRGRLSHTDTLAAHYRARGHRPQWVQQRNFPTAVASIMRFPLRAGEHGLDPRWYHAPALQEALVAVLTDPDHENDHSATLARLELLLSDGLLTYATHLRYGIVDPRRIDAEYHLPVRKPGLREFLEPLHSKDIVSYLRNVQPSDSRYRGLQAAYAQFRDIGRLYRWPAIPTLTVDKISAGDTSSVVPALLQRLMLTGELYATSHPPPRGAITLVDLARQAYELDSLRLYSLGAHSFDSTMASAVMRYQKRHGLLIDGIVGRRTVARMNRGIDDYTEQIRINLERFRWMRYPDRGRYILVNIPEYWLYAVNNGAVESEMPVCVGLPDLSTPQIDGEFSYLVLNPVWHVPWSIATKEIYYSAKKDSNYLQKGNYKVYRGGEVVDASAIEWANYDPEQMPYSFKQQSGRGNALGAIKFMFRNDFSIYLHDTPQQWAFKRAVRAVSHGCVRIKQPMEFARFLLDGTPKWDVARLQRVIWSGAQSKSVILKQRTPLFIDYYTVWVDAEGVLQFRDDIYGKDAVLSRVFQRRSAATRG